MPRLEWTSSTGSDFLAHRKPQILLRSSLITLYLQTSGLLTSCSIFCSRREDGFLPVYRRRTKDLPACFSESHHPRSGRIGRQKAVCRRSERLNKPWTFLFRSPPEELVAILLAAALSGIRSEIVWVIPRWSRLWKDVEKVLPSDLRAKPALSALFTPWSRCYCSVDCSWCNNHLLAASQQTWTPQRDDEDLQARPNEFSRQTMQVISRLRVTENPQPGFALWS